MVSSSSLDDLILSLNPTINNETRIIIFDGNMDDDDYEQIYHKLRMENWDDDGSPGPDCFFCNKSITAIDDFIIFNNQEYNIMWKGDFKQCDDHDASYLQCCYCFNYFHRSKCSLSFSETSFFAIQLSKHWSCPNCVPEFIPVNMKIDNNYEQLYRLAKILNPLLDQCLFCLKSLDISINDSIVIFFKDFFSTYEFG